MNESNGHVSRPASDAVGKAWLLMSPEAVPERWKSRQVPLMLVPLLPAEADEVLREGSAAAGMSAEEEAVAVRVAKGMSATEIARELHMTPRSVYRRLARLRAKLGAGNLAELAARLSAAGFD